MNDVKIQPQIVQLELKFKAPLVKDSVVNTVIDLLNLNTNYNYLDKLVWVREEKAYYYLNSGDGSELNNWKKHIMSVSITRYNPTEKYSIGSTVYLGSKIYNAKINIPVGINPIEYPDYWLCIAGETETSRLIFTNSSVVRVYTEIRNPKFEVIIGTVVYNSNNEPELDNDGLVKIINQEIIEALVIKPDNVTSNNGVAYDIYFYENELPVNLTGIINIK